jgi:hypothetical protein
VPSDSVTSGAAIGAVRYPGIKIHDPRVIRLLEVLLHGGSHVGGWTAKQIHRAVLTTFHLSDRAYGLNQATVGAGHDRMFALQFEVHGTLSPWRRDRDLIASLLI